MAGNDIGRDEIHIISRNSNWTEGGIDKAFQDSGTYAGTKTWQKFLNFFLMGLGASFMVTGILFFFAYNWADLHRFVKLGLIQFLILVAIGMSTLFKKLSESIRNIILAAAAVLVGVLFAVFGQIYQTGADAYDFFLGWMVAIALWAFVSGFPVLWFIFMLLCNITLFLYQEQVAYYWNGPGFCNLLFLLNLIFLILVEWSHHKNQERQDTRWLTGILVIGAAAAITFSVCYGIVDDSSRAWGLSLLLAAAGFTGGIVYGIRTRNLLYMAVIPFAILIILLTLVIKPLHDPVGIFFIISIFIAAFTTLLIIQLVKLNKRWHEHEPEHE